jgi:hemin uptake protein HemP
MQSESRHSRHSFTPSSTGAGEDTRAAVIDSRVLFGKAEVVHIDHRGSTYTLRRTRNGKLILTK